MTQKTGPAARVRTVNSWSTSSVVYNATVTCTVMPLSLRQHGTLRQQFCSTSTVPGQGLALALFIGLNLSRAACRKLLAAKSGCRYEAAGNQAKDHAR